MNDASTTVRSAAPPMASGVSVRALVRSMTTTRAIDAKLVRELPVAHVDRDDARGAALQEAIGEAAGRRPEVEATQAARRRARTRRARPRASRRRARRRRGRRRAPRRRRPPARARRPCRPGRPRRRPPPRARRPGRALATARARATRAGCRGAASARRVTSSARRRADGARAPALASPSATRGPGRRTRGSSTGTTWPSRAARTWVQPGASGRMRDAPLPPVIATRRG